MYVVSLHLFSPFLSWSWSCWFCSNNEFSLDYTTSFKQSTLNFPTTYIQHFLWKFSFLFSHFLYICDLILFFSSFCLPGTIYNVFLSLFIFFCFYYQFVLLSLSSFLLSLFLSPVYRNNEIALRRSLHVWTTEKWSPFTFFFFCFFVPLSKYS